MGGGNENDDLGHSEDPVAAPSFAASTVQRDAPTTRFYDARGNVTGSASTYGNVTKFYAPRRLVGTNSINQLTATH
jgi:hypothetical protein